MAAAQTGGEADRPDEATEQPDAANPPEDVAPEMQPEPAPDEPPEEQSTPSPDHQTHSAADVAGAPRPGQESGVARAESHPEHALLWVPRTLLFVPRLALEVVDAPIRGFLWAYERYDLRDRAYQIFFNEEGTIGLFPVAYLESEFGFNIGVRFIARDVFGAGEGINGRVSFGGRFDRLVSLELDSGERFGDRFELELRGLYEVRPKDKFFGIGNEDTVDDAMGLDALDRGPAVKSRYRQSIWRAILTGDVRLTDTLHLRPSGAFTTRNFEDSDAASMSEVITDNFDPDTLVGWETGIDQLYGEVELRWDARTTVQPYEPAEMWSGGFLLAGFAGYATGLGDDDTDFGRYGVDAQKFFRLGAGPRIISLRAYAEAITGDVADVPFADLPELGGAMFLRGYDRDRFRDRTLALVQGEYQWGLSQNFSATLFVDAGRVYPKWRDFTVDDLRVGYGGALEFHTTQSFLARFSIESSIDGDIFFNLTFDPVYDPRARVERR